MLEVSLIILLLLLIVFSAIAIIYFAGQKNILWFTEIKSGTFKVKQAGGKIVDIMLDFEGYKYDEATDEIVAAPNYSAEPNFLGRWLVSWLWPFERIQKFHISVDSLAPNYQNKNKVVEKVVVPGLREVDNIRVIIPRPFVVLDADLAEGTKVEMLLVAIFMVVNPKKLISHFPDQDFFPPIGTEVSRYLLEIVKELDYYKDFLPMNKALDVTLLNVTLQKLFGIICLSLKIDSFNLSPEGQRLEDARLEKRVAEEKGDAKVITAEKDAKAKRIGFRVQAEEIRALSEAGGDRYKNLIEALLNAKVAKEEIPGIINNQEKWERLKESNLTTLVDGGSTQTTLPIGGK